jgi:hypothetical protein
MHTIYCESLEMFYGNIRTLLERNEHIVSASEATWTIEYMPKEITQ